MEYSKLPGLNGSLFKDESETRRDYSGSFTITREEALALTEYLLSSRAEGDQYGLKLYVSGWKKVSQNGKQYLSLRIEPPRRAFETPAAPAAAPYGQGGSPGQPYTPAAQTGAAWHSGAPTTEEVPF